MMNAYDPIYLEQGQLTLASMLDYARHGLRMQLNKFYPLFLATGVADRFGICDVSILAGHSGVELAHIVLEKAGMPTAFVDHDPSVARSKEFWAGWALAYYQWKSGRRFATIASQVSIDETVAMYHPYHEMDILQFADAMDARFGEIDPETNLARLRKYAEMSQRMLAERSAVPLRTIQQYEQRQKDISKAGASHLLQLAHALQVPAESLLD